MSRRYLIKPQPEPVIKNFRTHSAAIAAAIKCGAPNTAVDSLLLADGTFQAVVLLRLDQEWMTAHIMERGVRAQNVNAWTPSGRKV